jgi:hypothetical protein
MERIGGKRTLVCTVRLVALTGLALMLAGCLGAPKLEDRWSRVDLTGSNLAAYQSVSLGAPESVTAHVAITYRSILTGYAVAELRASSTVTSAAVRIAPDAPRARMASDIDSLLDHSVSIGRAIRPVTGWDHLIQRIDFSFGAAVPTVLDSTGASSGGLFLLCYLGSGDRIERINMPDTVIVTPFKSSAYQILPVGLTLQPVGPVAP